ncbi:MAG: glutathione peroxidase [Bythopirellula sp.]|nr:glutathione peroxidase [Bythopirellula sp.]
MVRMKDIFALGASLLAVATGCGETVQGVSQEKSALSFKVESLDGQEVDLSKYQGKVVMIVNVASKCGLTPQYEQLQALNEKYADKGLVILGFPCNQFLGQEPGTAAEIGEFCRKNYGVTFDMFAKVDVKGDKASDLYKLLTALDTEPTGAGDISWNFEKFVLDRNGFVVGRFGPRTKPDAPEIVALIEKQLENAPQDAATVAPVASEK